jgi:hypothetical protein
MRIDSSGNVGIGVSSVATVGSRRVLQIDNGAAGGCIALGNAATGTDNALIVGNTLGAGVQDLGLAGGGATGVIVLFTNGTERMRVLANGTIQTVSTVSVGNATPSTSGAGITFPATQSASSDANTLDDYEEGTWTPVVSDAASGGNLATLSNAEAVYTKIGNIVYWRFNVVLTSKASMTAGNDVYIQGFPFQSAAIANSWYNPFPTIIRNITFTDFVQFNQVGSTTYGYFRENVSNAAGSNIIVSDITDSAAMQASGFYRVA